jgi:hypothetical protein
MNLNTKTVVELIVAGVTVAFIGWLSFSVLTLHSEVEKTRVEVEELSDVKDNFQGIAFAIARAHPDIRVSQILRSSDLAALATEELQRALDLIHADSVDAAVAYLAERGVQTATIEAMVGPTENI